MKLSPTIVLKILASWIAIGNRLDILPSELGLHLLPNGQSSLEDPHCIFLLPKTTQPNAGHSHMKYQALADNVSSELFTEPPDFELRKSLRSFGFERREKINVMTCEFESPPETQTVDSNSLTFTPIGDQQIAPYVELQNEVQSNINIERERNSTLARVQHLDTKPCLAKLDDQIVGGFTLFQPGPSTSELLPSVESPDMQLDSDSLRLTFVYDLMLRSGFRGKGLGSRLINNIKHMASQSEGRRAQHCLAVLLTDTLVPFYSRNDFAMQCSIERWNKRSKEC